MLKKLNILLLILIPLAFAVPAFSQKKVDIFGYYTPVRPTAAFADISEIHLAGDYGEQQTPKFHGLIRLRKRSAKDFQLMRPTLTGKKLTFTTRAAGGIHYTFAGAFTKLGDFPATRPEGEKLLRGTLTKFRGKKKLAAGTFSFIYSAGD